jgi:hypothetical protein
MGKMWTKGRLKTSQAQMPYLGSVPVSYVKMVVSIVGEIGLQEREDYLL